MHVAAENTFTLLLWRYAMSNVLQKRRLYITDRRTMDPQPPPPAQLNQKTIPRLNWRDTSNHVNFPFSSFFPQIPPRSNLVTPDGRRRKKRLLHFLLIVKRWLACCELWTCESWFIRKCKIKTDPTGIEPTPLVIALLLPVELQGHDYVAFFCFLGYLGTV